MTILTPSRWLNSQGLLMSPHLSRNTDGIDPGETSFATCGVLAHNTISTGDDHIAIKGGHGVIEHLSSRTTTSAPATGCRSAARPTAACTA